MFFRRGHRPVLDTCANEAIPRQGKGGLINHLYLLVQFEADFRNHDTLTLCSHVIQVRSGVQFMLGSHVTQDSSGVQRTLDKHVIQSS